MATIIQGAASDREKRYILSRLKRAFNPDTFDPSVPSGLPGLIAGPPVGNPFNAFQRRVGRATCDRWARGDRPGIIPYRDSYYRELCDPYLGLDAPGQPTTAPPFSGGQCDGSFYRCSIEGPSGGQTVWGGLYVAGPINGIRVRPGSPNARDLLCRGILAPGNLVSNTGPKSFPCVTSPTPGSLIWRPIPFGFSAAPTFTVLQNCTIASDNCGSLPPTFTPGTRNPSPDPNPGPIGGPAGYPFPSLDIDISPDGSIVVDFGDGSPPEEFDPTGLDDGGGGGSSVPTTPGTPGPVETTGDGGEDSGQAPEDSELTGVLVRVVSSPPNANRFDNISTPTFRGVGYVAMGYPGLLGIDTSAAVVQSPQFFHAQQRGLTNWRVRANVGFSLESTPYYREIVE